MSNRWFDKQNEEQLGVPLSRVPEWPLANYADTDYQGHKLKCRLEEVLIAYDKLKEERNHAERRGGVMTNLEEARQYAVEWTTLLYGSFENCDDRAQWRGTYMETLSHFMAGVLWANGRRDEEAKEGGDGR